MRLIHRTLVGFLTLIISTLCGADAQAEIRLPNLFGDHMVLQRDKPLRIWGPNGAVPEMGTAYAVDGMERMLAWDLAGRAGQVDFRGYRTEVTEFDYKGVNQVIYEDNGVVIRSWPAIHSIDGPVSFSLKWNGLKFVFGSDTYPNKWFLEYAKDADIAIHECFVAAPDIVSKLGFTPESALQVGTQIHTAPEAFGKVMSEIRPRMAVAYHFFKDFDTTTGVYERVRTTYDGPLSLAEDFMVWNVTKDEIRTRMAVPNHESFAAPVQRAKQQPPNPYVMTKFSALGVEPESAAVTNEVIAKYNKENGLNVKPSFTAIPFMTEEQRKKVLQQFK